MVVRSFKESNLKEETCAIEIVFKYDKILQKYWDLNWRGSKIEIFIQEMKDYQRKDRQRSGSKKIIKL